MSHKRPVLIFISFIIAFVGVNYAVWKLCSEELITETEYVAGDLTRMGYILNSKTYRKDVIDLPRRHLEPDDYHGQKIELLTIGDSFSWGGGGGRNRFYQDYIASLNNIEVMNIYPYREKDAITTIAALCNNGIIDRMKPRYILIESSQKFSIDDFAKRIDFDLTIPAENREMFRSRSNTLKPPPVGFINNGNFKFLIYNLLYSFSDHAFMGKVCTRKLTKEMFTAKNGESLLFLRDEVKRIPRATPEAIGVMNRNLNTLAEKLAIRGIRLYFMPCVDKYDLYREYIEENPYPGTVFFEELRILPKKYILIDTKAILADELRKGVKDIYYSDDSHWSWKASKKIFEAVRFR